MALKIGFANKYHTLWSIGEPYKKFIDDTRYVMSRDYTYIQNLAIDENKAIEKAKGFGVSDFIIDNGLKGKTSSFTITEDKIKSTQKDYEYPLDVYHSHGKGDIRRMGSGRYQESDNIKEIKALWVLYLKKDVVQGDGRGLKPTWVRPIVYARRRLIDLGILMRYDGRYMTEKQMEYLKNKKNCNDGHFGEDGKRVEMKLTCIQKNSYDTQYGICWFMKFKNGSDVYVYNGSGKISNEMNVDSTKNLKFTISHTLDNNGDKQTKIKRPTICEK